MKETTVKKIIEFFNDNEEIFNSCIEELDSYNGYLGDDRYHEMDFIDDCYSDTKPLDILYRAFYGYDEETYHTDEHGRKDYGAFNPNREYYKYNGYGNLVSADYKDYSAHLDNYFIDALCENRCYIPSIFESDELIELFDELEAETNEAQ